MAQKPNQFSNRKKASTQHASHSKKKVSPEPESNAPEEKADAGQLLEADAFLAFIVFNYAESMAR